MTTAEQQMDELAAGITWAVIIAASLIGLAAWSCVTATRTENAQRAKCQHDGKTFVHTRDANLCYSIDGRLLWTANP